jgi:hypothetical protein
MKTLTLALILAGAASAQLRPALKHSDGRGVYTTFQVPGCTGTVVTGINDAGLVVGSSSCGGFVRLPFPDPANPGFETLTIPGALYTVITGINDRDQVIGYYGYYLSSPLSSRRHKHLQRWL